MLLNLPQKLQNLKMVAAVSNFLEKPDLDNVYGVGASLQGSEMSRQMGRHLMDNPRFRALVEEKWRPPVVQLDELLAMPDGSLGHVYAHQLSSQGLDPESTIDHSEINSTASYIKHRMRETHDIIHVLTGFGVDASGEMGVLAFGLAQNRHPLAVLLILGSLLKALQEDVDLTPILRAISKGFKLGLSAQTAVAFKLEDGWQRPIEDWREEIGLPRNP